MQLRGDEIDEIINEEQKYLVSAIQSLKNEIDYYNNELIEIPKRYTRASQGDAFLVEGLMSAAAIKLRKLEMSINCPYFGRIDFLSDGSNEAVKIYIGKTNITGSNKEQVTTDWRTPICSLYYDSDLGKASYEAPCGIVEGDLKIKRQIIIKEGKLIDAIDNSIANNDELLQPYLSVNADNKMKTIIASIQKEQNKIIRRPISDNIIVQGVAGSGKTSVALHRIAYLIYNLGNNVKSNQFLIVGPNKYFLDYISSILPELETEPVEQKTYLDLVNESLGEKLSLEDINLIFNKSKNSKFAKKIQEYKSSLNYKNLLTSFMEKYLREGIIIKGFEIDGEEIYSTDDIKNILFSSSSKHPNFERAYSVFSKNYKENIETIYTKLNEKYRQIYINLPKGDEKRNMAILKSHELNQLVKDKGLKLLKEYFKKAKLKPLTIYKLFISNLSSSNEHLSKEEIDELQNDTMQLLKKNKITFSDLPALLYINNLLIGETNQYRHIVIDEAQDYGLFHFDVLKNKSPRSTFSIYGDLAQSIYSYRSIKDWDNLVKEVFDGNCEVLNLKKSYRTTIEITENANKILKNLNLEKAEPVIRHGTKVTFSEFSKDNEYKINKIFQWVKKGYKTIAIICKEDKEALKVHEMLNKFNLSNTLITAKETQYNGGICVLTSALSKGLEFDAVIINEASNFTYSEDSITDMHLLYVGCTRALHELDVLYNKEICKVFNEIKNTENENQFIR